MLDTNRPTGRRVMPTQQREHELVEFFTAHAARLRARSPAIPTEAVATVGEESSNALTSPNAIATGTVNRRYNIVTYSGP